MEAILRAAGLAIGNALRDPVDLGGSGRSVVLRCRTAAGDSVIVKAFTAEPEALDAFTSEAAGLSLGPAGPKLLGVDTAYPLLVIEDLGDAPTLADVLLGDDPETAAHWLSEWARALGRLAAGSVHRRADLARLRTRYGTGRTPPEDESWLARRAAALPSVLAEAGITAPPGLAEELATVGRAGEEEYPAFTPGDTCPDNCLLTSDGLRLIDFEAACYQSVFLTAAYCRMPFSSCWCVFRLPAGMSPAIERLYRSEVARAYPELTDDAVWQAGMTRAIAAWTAALTALMLPRTGEDRPLHPTRRPVPTRRQVLRHRWEMASTLEEFPAIAETMRLLLRDVAGAWDPAPLPGYPAFQQS